MRVPHIPEYQRQHQYQPPAQPAARLQGMQVQTSAAMFGGDAGRDLERAGYQLQHGAKALSRLYVDYQHTKATEAYNKFQESLTDELYGPEGIFNLKGEAAMEAPARAQTLLESKGREFAQKNGLAQGFFDDYVGRFRRQLMPQVGRFATEQRNNWMMQTQEGLAGTSMDLALRNYANPEVYRGHIVEGRDAIRKAGELAGLPPEKLQQNLNTYTSKVYSNIATAHIANGQYGAAEGLIKSGAISGPDAIKLQEHITTKKRADLQLSLTLKHEAERVAARKWEDSLTMALESGDMAAATELAVNAPPGFKKEGFALVDHYAKGKRVVNDEEEVWKWQQTLVNDPDRFVKEWNPTEHMSTMDRETRNRFTAEWEKLKAGDKARHDQVVTDATMLSEAYRIMGIKDPGKATGDDLARIMEFNRRFQEEIDVFAGEKKRKPTASEKLRIRDNMLVVAKESGSWWWKKKVFAFEASGQPASVPSVPGVPPEAIPNIQEILRKEGYDPDNPENIRKTHQHIKGGQP